MHLTTAVHACTLCTQTLLLLQLHYLLQQNARDCAEEAAVFTRARTVAPRTTTTPRRASTGGMLRGHAADVQALQELVLLLRTASEDWRADNANVSTPQLSICVLCYCTATYALLYRNAIRYCCWYHCVAVDTPVVCSFECYD
jgi:hypothetical protein